MRLLPSLSASNPADPQQAPSPNVTRGAPGAASSVAAAAAAAAAVAAADAEAAALFAAWIAASGSQCNAAFGGYDLGDQCERLPFHDLHSFRHARLLRQLATREA